MCDGMAWIRIGLILPSSGQHAEKVKNYSQPAACTQRERGGPKEARKRKQQTYIMSEVIVGLHYLKDA